MKLIKNAGEHQQSLFSTPGALTLSPSLSETLSGRPRWLPCDSRLRFFETTSTLPTECVAAFMTAVVHSKITQRTGNVHGLLSQRDATFFDLASRTQLISLLSDCAFIHSFLSVSHFFSLQTSICPFFFLGKNTHTKNT